MHSVSRLYIAATAAAFAIMALLWHDAATWQEIGRLWRLPQGRTIGDIVMIVQIVAAVLIVIPRTTRFGATALLALCGIYVADYVPVVAAEPGVFTAYGSLSELVALACGAFVLVQAWPGARVLLGVCAVVFGIQQIVLLAATTPLVPSWIPLSATLWVNVTTAAFLAAGGALIFGYRSQLAAFLLAAMLTLFGLLVWLPHVIAGGPHAVWSEFLYTLWIAAAAACVGAFGSVADGKRRR